MDRGIDTYDRRAASAGGGVKPVDSWSAQEHEKRALLEQGIAVAVNMRPPQPDRMGEGARAVRQRRPRHAVGNPFVLGRDGDRLPARPDLLARLGERGKALGCWCASQPCHADALIQ